MEGEEDERWLDKQGGGGAVEGGGAEEGCEKLSCVTVMLVDSWSAVFHRSPYCLLGGLSGRKQVSAQIASENNISESLSPPSFFPLCHMMALKPGYPSLPCSWPM